MADAILMAIEAWRSRYDEEAPAVVFAITRAAYNLGQPSGGSMNQADAARIANAIHRGAPLPQIAFDGNPRDESIIVAQIHEDKRYDRLVEWTHGMEFEAHASPQSPFVGNPPHLYRVERRWFEDYCAVTDAYHIVIAELVAMKQLECEKFYRVRIVEEA